VDFDTQDMPEALPRNVTLVTYRILQEGLRNCAKHARASSVTVSVECVDRTLRLCVKDNGVGFDLSVAQGHIGLGLASMQERARLVDGEMTVLSSPGEGTCIELVIPFEEVPKALKSD